MFLSFLLASSMARAFDYSDLRKLVEERDLRSVEATLPLLPPLNVVIMRESRSLQAASFEKPRVILFNDDASLVMSYTGEERGGHRFEIMSFANAHFDFKSIEFGDGRAQVNEKPQNCRGCHGFMKDDLRPVWDPGLIWRGAFGAQDDHLTDVEAEAYQKLTGHSRSNDHTQIENRPNLQLGLLLMRQQVKRLVRLAGPDLRKKLCQTPAAPPEIVPNLRRFMDPVYGAEFTEAFIRDEATSLQQTIGSLMESGLQPTDIPLTIEKNTFAAFDGSFSLRELLFGELARGLHGVFTFRSLSESQLGLKTSPALTTIDRVGQALSEESAKQLCEM